MPEVIHIVGGGPSLIGFDWGSLASQDVIAVNDAYQHLPNARVIVFNLLAWYDLHRLRLAQHRARKIRFLYPSAPKLPKTSGVEEWKVDSTSKFALDKGFVTRGRNCGYMAINLAAQLGAKEIHLHGFDMRLIDGRAHFHDEAVREERAEIYALMAREFDLLTKPLADLDVKVWNRTAGSAIRAFPFKC